MRFCEGWGADDVELLKAGRHFQIAPEARVVASRREEENYRLRALARADDRFYINAEKNGAVVLLRGRRTPATEAAAAGLAVYYSKMREQGSARVASWRIEGGEDVDRAENGAGVVDPDSLRGAELALAGKDCVKQMRTRPSRSAP